MSALGFNTGYVEELYRQYLEEPDSVSESWREFFADYRPSESFLAAAEARPAPTETRHTAKGRGDGATPEPIAPASAPTPADGVETKAIRGASARIVENMEASLGVPTATSLRTVPVKLMAENRALINDYQRYIGGEKVSFTHLIAWAVVQGLKAFPNMNTTFRHDNGTYEHIIPNHVNLGLAIDIERRGRRSLLVPNIKAAEEMTFAQFLGIYGDIIKRARNNQLELSDFEGTTATLTNPGMIGTTMSVARLMPGQGVIVGAGSIGYPQEYHAFAPDVVSRTGMSQVMTITSTYDHRVIQGAESGAFLQYIDELFLGKHDFYRKLFADLGVPYQPYKLLPDSTPQIGSGAEHEMEMTRKRAAVLQLIRAYRVRGHLQANVNPLGYDWTYHPELDPNEYGLSIWDLDRTFITGGLGGKENLPLREILSIVRDTYTRKIGIEYMHISSPQERGWLQERIEPVRCEEPLSHGTKVRILKKLNAAEAFERFLHTKFIGHKRFSLEGAESVIPMLDKILSDAAEQDVEEVVIGMAHRGRLNVLANILNKPYEVIFSEFEGSIDPETTQGSGDVKYHLGARGVHESPTGRQVKLWLASNPSHLEAVNPVVEGMVRARQEMMRARHDLETPSGDYLDAVIPILIHGDAAFAGQGVVAETLNFSKLRGYQTGGTIHIVINNQIGFTTAPSDARSSRYATDIARMIQAPIIHVNGDDPEAVVRVARLALDYRQVFNKDVVIDMVCYRVHGHNEGDEPTYTQPLLYKKIEAQRSPRKLYTESLLGRGEMMPEEAEGILDDYRVRLQEAFDRTRELDQTEVENGFELLDKRKRKAPKPAQVDTAASEEDLMAVVNSLTNLPSDFNVHRKLARQFKRREELFAEKKRIDWAFAEALAIGTLLQDGATVRLSGQDSRRGTFSHRHAVLYDQETGEEYIPLNHIRDDQARLLVYDSLLSEYAACGFEYGYTVGDPSALVVWEAQFGDFANGAQIIYDQFMSAAEEKWGQTSSLVLLLPHGYEGQGPEHSSARLERFLQQCAEDNMIVASFTTPANLFHALRRQVKREVKKPLVVMAPKSLLRHPRVISTPEELTDGQFHPVYPAEADPKKADRLVICSGKVYYDLIGAMTDEEQQTTAIARLEQFYPWPEAELAKELKRYKNVEDVVWVQEEPANMGAWQFARYQLDDMLEALHGNCEKRVKYIGRAASASTATGSSNIHERQQQAIINEALKRA